jgi:hypothetical protein
MATALRIRRAAPPGGSAERFAPHGVVRVILTIRLKSNRLYGPGDAAGGLLDPVAERQLSSVLDSRSFEKGNPGRFTRE